MIHSRIFGFVLLSLCEFVLGRAADLTPVRPPEIGQLAEFRLAQGPTAENNFDPDQIRIDARILTPSGTTISIPAFWFQDYARTKHEGIEKLTPMGNPEWRIRFVPTEAGDYGLNLFVTQGNASAQSVASTHFNVSAAAHPSPHGVVVRKDTDLATADGRPLRLIGENICWGSEQATTYDLDRWLEQLHRAGGNFARVWLAPWSLAIEHRPGTLNHYDPAASWQLDHLFETAEREGIFIMLCLDHHGMYQINNSNWDQSNNYWKSNPYNQSVGGPCAVPNDFFSTAAAQKIYQKRLRYLIARVGYSPQLLAWEFFNEIDNVFAPNQTLVEADVVAWHKVMGQWMRANDPFHHLLTSSLTGGSDRESLWKLPEMDLSQYHSYSDADPAHFIDQTAQSFIKRYGKPTLIGEFGVSAKDWAVASDPHLRGFRQGMWGAALSGSAGNAMPWWWQDIEKDDAYPLYTAMRDILERGKWNEGEWKSAHLAGHQAPFDLDGAIENELPFTTELPLANFQRHRLRSEVAVANPLAAERASESLGSYLLGTINANWQQPIQLKAIFAEKGKFSFRVNSVASDVTLLVKVDDQEVLKTEILDIDHKKVVNHEINRTFSFNVTPGLHVIQISNTGKDWAYLEALRLENVRLSRYPGGWTYPLGAVGLINSEEHRALVYVYSPFIAYPAGALSSPPPLIEKQSVALPSWSAGTFVAHWFDPRTGRETTASHSTTGTDGVLTLAVPAMHEDAVAVIEPDVR